MLPLRIAFIAEVSVGISGVDDVVTAGATGCNRVRVLRLHPEAPAVTTSSTPEIPTETSAVNAIPSGSTSLGKSSIPYFSGTGARTWRDCEGSWFH